MGNRPGLCWSCVRRENCKMHKKDVDKKVIDCGRYIMKDGDQALMKHLF